MEDLRLFQQLLDSIAKYNPESDSELIERAYLFAKKAHNGQNRKSGEEYIIHPLYASLNLARLEADDVSIIASLLHDVVEDTSYTLEDIKKEFGLEVSNIVDGVTKLSKIKYTTDMDQGGVESLRKLFISATKDIRVFLVKICDRIHNLETLEHLSEEKRKRIAGETLEIYVPIINLLSLGEFIGEVEDLCFKYLYGEDYKRLNENFGAKYGYYRDKIGKAHDRLNSECQNNKIKVNIFGRVKSLYSIYKKMQSKNIPLESIYDVVALRVVTNNKEDCYRILGIIHDIYKVKFDRFKDYISSPKDNGYQGIHTTVFDRDGDMVEFQIQSEDMYKLNRTGLASHVVYKNYDSKYSNTPDWMKEILEIQKKNIDSESFLEKLKSEVLTSRIQTFTPNGDVIDLPKGSCLIDFAFRIHTDFGFRFDGAYINGQYIEDPGYILNDADLVKLKILKEKYTDYPVELVSVVKTHLARENLKRLFKKQSNYKKKQLGKFLFSYKIDSLGMKYLEDIPRSIRIRIFDKFSVDNLNDFYIGIGSGTIDTNRVLKYINNIYNLDEHIKKVSLRIYLKTIDFNTTSRILEVFHNLNISLKKIKYKDDRICVNFLVDNFKNFQYLLGELSRVPNVKEVQRIFPFRVIVFYILFFLFIILIISLFYFINNFAISEEGKDLIWTDTLFFINFLAMYSLVLFFRYLAKRTLPDILKHNYFWIAIFLLNTLVLLIIFLGMVLLEDSFNSILFLGLFLGMYALLTFEYINYKIERSTKK